MDCASDGAGEGVNDGTPDWTPPAAPPPPPPPPPPPVVCVVVAVVVARSVAWCTIRMPYAFIPSGLVMVERMVDVVPSAERVIGTAAPLCGAIHVQNRFSHMFESVDGSTQERVMESRMGQQVTVVMLETP
jgi:hypothetical protein